MRRSVARDCVAALLRHLSMFLIAFGLTTLPASAAKRIALVVGNAAYRSAPVLPNPTNDAAAMRKALESTGFEVVHASDATATAFRSSLETFAKAVEQAGPGTAAVVFYAGHAVQIEGTNYLLPVDVTTRSDADIRSQSVSLGDILTRLDATAAATKIVILDACRDNPFAPGSGARGLAATLLDDGDGNSEAGLARVASKGGTLVAFATSPGAQAADGAGEHSPYTAALLDLLPEPGLPVEQLFRRVRLSVHDATSGLQTPWETSSLTTDFSFVASAGKAKLGKKGDRTARLDQTRPTRQALRVVPADDAYRTAVFWDEPEIYRIVLELYPDDLHALWVYRTLALRSEEIAWAEAVRLGDADAFRLFQRLYPGSTHEAEALRLASTAPGRALRTAALCGPATPTRSIVAPTKRVEKTAPAKPKPKQASPARKAQKPSAPKPQRGVAYRPPVEREPVIVQTPPALDPGAAVAIGILGGALIGGAMDRGPRPVRPRPYYPDGGVRPGGFPPGRDVPMRPPGRGGWQPPGYVPR